MVGVHAFQGTRWTVAGEVPGLAGNHHPSIAPYGMFATATRADPDRLRVRGTLAGLRARRSSSTPADPRFATNADRVGHRDELIAVIEAAFADRTAEDCLAVLAEAGVPSGKVRTLDDVYDWEQTLSQGLLRRRRPPDAREHRAARLADPLRRQRVLRRPAYPPRTPEARPARRRDPGVARLRLLSRDLHRTFTSRPRLLTSARSYAADMSSRRILVVEDEPVINQAVSDRLESEGYDVVRAFDGPRRVVGVRRATRPTWCCST